MSRPAGFHHTEITKAKLRAAFKGKPKSAYARRCMSIAAQQRTRESWPWTGKKRPPYSAEWRRKLSESHRGKKHSIETRRKIGLGTKGPKHPNWKGGVSYGVAEIRRSIEYSVWRTAVFERDGYACTECGATSRKEHGCVPLQAHHIKSFSEHPEIRFDVDNGQTLCLDCHKKTDNYCKH
jgi:hypothetical protein